jgi:hypothetical protein
MNRPMDRGARIDARRYTYWVSQFSGYRTPVTNRMIELWLDQFVVTDRDLAARILDAVLFINILYINTSYRSMLASLDGWSRERSERRGRWFFVPFSGSTGESGDSMVHVFRMATEMTKREYNELFIHRSELVARNPSPDDTVVLIDDFTGTGNQARDSWREFFAELLTGGPRVVLMIVVATRDALDRITTETEMEPICGTVLQHCDNLFLNACTYFTNEEKETVLKYCRKADQRRPKGYGDAGLLVVFSHRCPNNSIPILHVKHSRWQGLFPRHD